MALSGLPAINVTKKDESMTWLMPSSVRSKMTKVAIAVLLVALPATNATVSAHAQTPLSPPDPSSNAPQPPPPPMHAPTAAGGDDSWAYGQGDGGAGGGGGG
jgi:hypothetical protein